METCSALLAICAGNSPAASEFPAQRPVTRSFDVLFDLLLYIVVIISNLSSLVAPEVVVMTTYYDAPVTTKLVLWVLSIWVYHTSMDFVIKTATGAKPLPEPTMASCQVEPREYITGRNHFKGPVMRKKKIPCDKVIMVITMTSSNGNIFRVTGHLCGEFTGPRWIPHTKASDAELWCFLWSAPE